MSPLNSKKKKQTNKHNSKQTRNENRTSHGLEKSLGASVTRDDSKENDDRTAVLNSASNLRSRYRPQRSMVDGKCGVVSKLSAVMNNAHTYINLNNDNNLGIDNGNGNGNGNGKLSVDAVKFNAKKNEQSMSNTFLNEKSDTYDKHNGYLLGCCENVSVSKWQQKMKLFFLSFLMFLFSFFVFFFCFEIDCPMFFTNKKSKQSHNTHINRYLMTPHSRVNKYAQCPPIIIIIIIMAGIVIIITNSILTRIQIITM